MSRVLRRSNGHRPSTQGEERGSTGSEKGQWRTAGAVLERVPFHDAGSNRKQVTKGADLISGGGGSKREIRLRDKKKWRYEAVEAALTTSKKKKGGEEAHTKILGQKAELRGMRELGWRGGRFL